MKNKKGFTLVELLVTIVILGIVTGISIPIIRNVQSSMTKKKYTTYYNGLKSSAKLYNDSYGEDYIGSGDVGVYCIKYEDLEKRKLLKDINIENVTCNKEKTFVRVTKIEDKYVYSPYLECGEKDQEESSVYMPEGSKEREISLDFCKIEDDATILITADESQTKGLADKKRKKTKVTLASYTGIYNSVNIKAQWVKENEEADPNKFEPLTFKIQENQKEKLLTDGIVSTTSKELVTPQGGNGKYYLVLEVNKLVDLYGRSWKNKKPEDGKYVKFGPFIVDNTPPTCPQITAVSNGKKYQPNVWTNGNIEFTFKFDNDTNTWDFYTNNITTGAYSNNGNNAKTVTKKTVGGEGIRHIRLYLYDLAKNKKECKYDNVNYNIDKTKPTCGTATGASTTWTKNNRTIKQACSDKLNNKTSQASGCEKASYDKAYSSTIKTDKVTIKDKAGNTNNCTYNVYVDKTAPTCGTATGSSTTWTNANRTIKQACNDGTNQSNCEKASYNKTYTTSTKTDKVTIKDKAGNTKDCSYNVYVDKNAPTCTNVAKIDNSNGSNYSSGTVTCSNVYTNATCSDTGGSDCNKKEITTSGSTTNVTNNSNYSQWTVEARGTSYVTWKVFDKAGNSTSCSRITVKKGTESASSACGCASYNYPCTKTRTYYASASAEKCQPRSRQVETWRCGEGVLGTDTNLCCKFTSTYTGTCVSDNCQQYNTCCHE